MLRPQNYTVSDDRHDFYLAKILHLHETYSPYWNVVQTDYGKLLSKFYEILDIVLDPVHFGELLRILWNDKCFATWQQGLAHFPSIVATLSISTANVKCIGFMNSIPVYRSIQHFIGDTTSLAASCTRPGPQFNIKMSSYQYRKSHCGDNTVVRSSYLHNGISYTDKMSSLYRIGALDMPITVCVGFLVPTCACTSARTVLLGIMFFKCFVCDRYYIELPMRSRTSSRHYNVKIKFSVFLAMASTYYWLMSDSSSPLFLDFASLQ